MGGHRKNVEENMTGLRKCIAKARRRRRRWVFLDAVFDGCTGLGWQKDRLLRAQKGRGGRSGRNG